MSSIIARAFFIINYRGIVIYRKSPGIHRKEQANSTRLHYNKSVGLKQMMKIRKNY